MIAGMISAILGNLFYALAYRANNLYLILVGRMVNGVGFANFMYNKRYCNDPRLVGTRRRTQIAGWLVVGQGIGFSAGPFLGGLLYKIGFSNNVFNGYSSPGWLMTLVWVIFLFVSFFSFEDVPRPVPVVQRQESVELRSVKQLAMAPSQSPLPSSDSPEPIFHMTPGQWGVVACMCWQAFTCFFILGGWEANIPVFTGTTAPFYYSPFAAGNFIALGGVASFPLLFLNVMFARRIQDRHILATGTALGLAGLLITLATLKTGILNFASFFLCWFLVALGFNLASTVTMSLLSKQLPGNWNLRNSMVSAIDSLSRIGTSDLMYDFHR
jgi:MFS family permease